MLGVAKILNGNGRFGGAELFVFLGKKPNFGLKPQHNLYGSS